MEIYSYPSEATDRNLKSFKNQECEMKTITYGIMAMAVPVLISSVVIAQNSDEITVQATRNMSAKTVPTPQAALRLRTSPFRMS